MADQRTSTIRWVTLLLDNGEEWRCHALSHYPSDEAAISTACAWCQRDAVWFDKPRPVGLVSCTSAPRFPERSYP